MRMPLLSPSGAGRLSSNRWFRTNLWTSLRRPLFKHFSGSCGRERPGSGALTRLGRQVADAAGSEKTRWRGRAVAVAGVRAKQVSPARRGTLAADLKEKPYPQLAHQAGALSGSVWYLPRFLGICEDISVICAETAGDITWRRAAAAGEAAGEVVVALRSGTACSLFSAFCLVTKAGTAMTLQKDTHGRMLCVNYLRAYGGCHGKVRGLWPEKPWQRRNAPLKLSACALAATWCLGRAGADGAWLCGAGRPFSRTCLRSCVGRKKGRGGGGLAGRALATLDERTYYLPPIQKSSNLL